MKMKMKKMGHHHDHHHDHHRDDGKTPRSQTLPSSPTHSSSSSSDFEFTRVSLSPRKSSPADDLFYKGQLLPLHLSPRISMLRTLLLSSSSDHEDDHSSAASSDSHSSSSSCCDSSRPSSATDDDLHLQTKLVCSTTHAINNHHYKKHTKYFSISRFSSVFLRKETKTTTTTTTTNAPGSSVRRMSMTAKEMIRKYLKKAKPLYEKLSHKNAPAPAPNEVISHSFSGNLRFPKRRSCVSSCPSSMRSSPSRSGGVLCRNSVVCRGIYSTNSSSMEELQSAIQGAIAHCKSSISITH